MRENSGAKIGVVFLAFGRISTLTHQRKLLIFAACVVASVMAPHPTFATPHFYFSDTKQKVSEFQSDPANIHVDDAAQSLLNARPPFLTFADIADRFEQATLMPKDITSAHIVADASRTLFLSMVGRSALSPAPQADQILMQFSQMIPIQELGILLSNSAVRDSPDHQFLFQILADAKWNLTATALSITAPDYRLTLTPTAWLNDYRDGRDKLLLTIVESVPSGSYYAVMPVLVDFNTRGGPSIEHVPSYFLP